MNRDFTKGARVAILAIGIAVVTATAGIAPAYAQTSVVTQEISPDQLKLAREYVDLTDTGKVYETIILQAGVRTLKTIAQQSPDVVEQAKTAIGEVIDSYVGSKGELMDQFARIYALKFSTEELKQIVAFYSTPVGKKLSAENRDINSKLQKVVTVFTNNLKTEFYAKVRANLKQKGIEL